MRHILYTIALIGFCLTPLACQSNKSSADRTPKSQHFLEMGLQTNTSKSSIPLEKVLSGGPAKDGIPALTNPAFLSAGQVKGLSKDKQGVWVQSGEEKKFYPYNILVWHEIVNDVVGGIPLAITFCPLCGSAIVYERTVDGQVYEFGVSGKLWQSNLLMYDQTTESLWSQIEGRAVVGDLLESELRVFPAQLLTYQEALEIDSKVLILSTDTGYERDYRRYPYGDYESSETLYFPINHSDKRLHPKTLMIATTFEDQPVAFHREKLLKAKKASIQTAVETLTAVVSDDHQIRIQDENGKVYPSFVAMWFSWANHNKGEVWTGED